MDSSGWAGLRGTGLVALCCALAGCSTAPPKPAQVNTCVPASVAVGKIHTFEVDFTSGNAVAPQAITYRSRGGVQVLGEFVITNPAAVEAKGHVGVQEWRESLLSDYRLAPLASLTRTPAKEHFVVLKVRVTGEGELGDVTLTTAGPKDVPQGNFSLSVKDKC